MAFDLTGKREPWIESNVPFGLHFYDAARECVYALHTGKDPRTGILDVVDVRTRKVVATISLPEACAGMCITGDTGYLTAADKPCVYELDLASRKVVARMPVPRPGGKCVAAAAKLYVTTGKEWGDGQAPGDRGAAVEVLDLRTRRHERSIPVPGEDLQAIAWDSARYVYAAANYASKLVRIDTETDRLDPSLQATLTGRPTDMVIDRVRDLVILACEGADETMCIVSLTEKREVACYHGGYGLGMAAKYGQDGRLEQLWVPNVNACHITVLKGDDLVP